MEITDEEKRVHLRQPFEEAVKEAVRTGRRAGLSGEEIIRLIQETLDGEGDGTSQRGGMS
jgi:DNA-binding transcriptional regulator YhcF (GntR family)